MIPYCNFEGIGLIPWGPLAAGQLCRPVSALSATTRGSNMSATLSEADKTIINRVEEISKKKGITMAQVATLWSLAKVSSPIIGFSSVSSKDISNLLIGSSNSLLKIARLEESLVKGSLTEEEIKYLEEPYVTFFLSRINVHHFLSYVPKVTRGHA